jgi:hypothetical protein
MQLEASGGKSCALCISQIAANTTSSVAKPTSKYLHMKIEEHKFVTLAAPQNKNQCL